MSVDPWSIVNLYSELGGYELGGYDKRTNFVQAWVSLDMRRLRLRWVARVAELDVMDGFITWKQW